MIRQNAGVLLPNTDEVFVSAIFQPDNTYKLLSLQSGKHTLTGAELYRDYQASFHTLELIATPYSHDGREAYCFVRVR